MKFADCTVQTAEMAPEAVSTEALSCLRDLRNAQNSQKTPSTHTIWHIQRFISHNARQTRSGTPANLSFHPVSLLPALITAIVRSPVWSPLATSKLKTEKIPSNNFYLPFLGPCDPTRRERQTQKRRNLHFAVWELEVQARHPPPLKL